MDFNIYFYFFDKLKKYLQIIKIKKKIKKNHK